MLILHETSLFALHLEHLDSLMKLSHWRIVSEFAAGRENRKHKKLEETATMPKCRIDSCVELKRFVEPEGRHPGRVLPSESCL